MHEHNWSKVGLWETKDKAIYPCAVQDCPAALLKTPGQDVSTGVVLPDRLVGVVKEFEGLTFEDDPNGGIVKIVMTEVVESYKLHKMKFKPDDVIIDIGAHVGVVAVYLAKKYPGVIVYAYEPVWENYARLTHNIYNNGVSDSVYQVNRAVSGDGRRVSFNTRLEANSGGSSEWISGGKAESRNSDTLAYILAEIDCCRLLKIDAEGAEYDILLNTPADVLGKIDSIRGEFHTNKRLKKAGHKPAALRAWVKQAVRDVKVGTCRMAD